LLLLLAASAVLYTWGLGASSWANAYYSGAVQAGSENWKAFLFGSFDAANGITVDKPPASLWVMALSVRIFGLSSWSILVPQALIGVAAVYLLYATVRRWSGAAVGLLAGAILATTPVAVLMFRFNNPDALLVLLMVAGAALNQFQQYVAEGKIHYLISDGPAMAGPGGFGENTAQQITQWVAATFTATTVAGVTVYDLSAK
jgi:4-amino-4-deoxy-L-arabinose transferase-like glycosyltransferase